MKVLILGHLGMLGHMVTKYYRSKKIKVKTIENRWPSENFINEIKNSDCNFIINCIGSIHQKKPTWEDYKSNNISLPIFLADNFKGKMLHPSTDCVFDGSMPEGEMYSLHYTPNAMDDYGVSKAYISYILKTKLNVKQIRTSIIGPELNDKVSLFEWFFSQETVNGYSNHFWNGITTLEWAKRSLDIIKYWNNYENIIQLSTNCISKHELLTKINEIYKTNKKIIPVKKEHHNKCLYSCYPCNTIDEQLIELKNFYK